jgi:hypothetical protein
MRGSWVIQRKAVIPRPNFVATKARSVLHKRVATARRDGFPEPAPASMDGPVLRFSPPSARQ